jgi:hypothetical protein
VLVFDILDDRIPAAVIVDKVTITGCVDDVQAQPYAVLLNDVGNGLYFGGLSDGLCWRKAALGLDEV